MGFHATKGTLFQPLSIDSPTVPVVPEEASIIPNEIPEASNEPDVIIPPRTPKVVSRTLTGPAVVFSSDEEEEDTAAGQPVLPVHSKPEIENPISTLSNIVEEEEAVAVPTDPVEMSFEEALGMMRKNKPEKPEPEKPEPEKPVEIEIVVEEEEEVIDTNVEIEIGDIRELEEDDRIIVIPPPKDRFKI